MAHRHTTLPFIRRGFTLLEVSLAILLGSMVLLMSLGLFAAMDRSQARQTSRMNRALEMATARAALTRAMSSLIMRDGEPPREDEMQKRKVEDRLRAQGARAEQFDPDSLDARFALQPVESGLRVGDFTMQTLSITVRTPPVLGETETPETETARLIESQRTSVLTDIKRRSKERRNEKRAERTRLVASGVALSSGSATPQSQLTSAGVSVNMGLPGSGGGDGSMNNAGAGGNQLTPELQAAITAALQGKAPPTAGTVTGGTQTGTSTNGTPQTTAGTGAATSTASGATAALAGIEEVTDPALAPGLRGVFELIPEIAEADRQSSFGGESAAQPETSFALWWRELPLPDATENLSNLESEERDRLLAQRKRDNLNAPAPTTRRARLLSGLRWANWRVFRNEKFDPKMSATWAAELPAFVEFSFETLEGRREDWMFEVAWSIGQEPGSVIGGTGTLPLADPSGSLSNSTSTSTSESTKPRATTGTSTTPAAQPTTGKVPAKSRR